MIDCRRIIFCGVAAFVFSACKTANKANEFKSTDTMPSDAPTSLSCRMAAKKSKPYLVYQITLAGQSVTSVTYQSFPVESSEVSGKPGVLASFAGGKVKSGKSKLMISDAVDGDAGSINLYNRNDKITGRITYTNSAPEGLEGDGRGYNLICEFNDGSKFIGEDGDLSESEQVDFDLLCKQSAKSWARAKKWNKAAKEDITNRQFIQLKVNGKSDAPGLRGSRLLSLSYSPTSDSKGSANFMSLGGFDPAGLANFSPSKKELYIESMADGDSGFMTLTQNSAGVWTGEMNFPNGSAKGWFYGEDESVAFECN